MNTSEIKPAMRHIDLSLTIVEIDEPRPYVSQSGKQGRVATAVGEDDSGKIKVSLWDQDIDRVKVGSKIRITNGYARLFRDEVHVSAGMYGKLEVLE